MFSGRALYGLLGLAFVLVAFQTPSVETPCPVTRPTTQQPGDEFFASSTNTWFRSEDGELWVNADRFYADGIKVGWRKPPGSTLEVTGQRSDGEAPPLEASIPDGYPGVFQASGLNFATGGCWEVEARAEQSILRFVTYVYPKAFKSPLGLIKSYPCESIDNLVKASSLVLIGTVEGNYGVAVPAKPAFIWQTIRAEEIWHGALEDGERVEVLSDLDYGYPLEVGASYLLFLSNIPGYHLQTLCPAVQINGDQIIVNVDLGPLVTGQKLNELAEIIEALPSSQ